MDSSKLRQEFLNFFEKRGHKVVPSSSLLSTDPSVLFTTAGMQQFKEYYLSRPSPFGNRVVSCQKCFRTSDIEEVGDEKHLTFLEMLGNFSFADYFKKETIGWALQFLVKDCKLQIDKLWITVFKGDEKISEDTKSQEIWQSLGIPKDRIYGFNKKENFWGPTGDEGPCGPTTEIHYDLTEEPCKKGKQCIPNCDCGRFVEIWNLVFNEYYQDKNGNLTLLKQKGVDTGMGLERLVMICQGKPSVYEIDLFKPVISEIKKMMKVREIEEPSSFDRLYKPPIAFEIDKERIFQELKYSRNLRIIADHIKGSVFLIAEGIFPSNVGEGYVLRRILRRAIRFGKLLDLPQGFLIPLAQKVVEIYQDIYPEIKSNETDILTVIQNEGEKFEKTLGLGLKEFKSQIAKSKLKAIPGKIVFDLYQSYGFPLELTKELAREEGFEIDEEGFKEEFKKHQEISRAGVEKKFGGVGKETTYESAKLHTATHLLHSALRKILGPHVKQMGSDITLQRLRFDFSHPQKMTIEEIKKVEDLVNQKIKEDLEVKKEEMRHEEAIKSGALAFFKEKYPEKVTVYSVGDPSSPSGQAFSKEICAGPHVKKTSELGSFKIIKEESSGAGIRRIRGILE